MEGVPNSSMPGWKDRFNEQEIASVIAYILTLSKPGPEAPESPLVSAPSPTTQPARNVAATSPSAPVGSAAVATATSGIVGDPQKGKVTFL